MPGKVSLLAAAGFAVVWGCSCAPKLQSAPSPLPSEPRRIVRVFGDTAAYTIEFADERERRKFVSGIDNLIDKYSRRIETDTAGSYIRIRVLPTRPEPAPAADASCHPAIDTAVALSIEEPRLAADTAPAPLQGGSIAFYSHRAFLDAHLMRLVQTDPFAGAPSLGEGNSSGHCPPFLRAEQLSAKRLRLALADRMVNGQGQRVSAFDIVDAWNAFVRAAPAQARGIFRNAAGIEGMLRGAEAVLRGIQAADERSIVISFTTEDEANERRLHTPALLPASLKLGRYFIKDAHGPALTLAANRSFPCEKAFLDQITLTLGGDPNPLLSFSLGKYDAATIYAARDLEYARAKLADKASALALGRDHYFLAIGIAATEMRAFLRQCVKPAEILARSVKASGPLLVTLADTIAAESAQEAGAGFLLQAPAGVKPLIVVFLKADPVSCAIADQLFADLSRAGISCQLKPCDPIPFEQATAAQAFDVAVGWAPSQAMSTPAAQLAIADQWFGGMRDEQIRLQENREIPLFVITTYALFKKGIALHRGDIAGISRVVPPL